MEPWSRIAVGGPSSDQRFRKKRPHVIRLKREDHRSLSYGMPISLKTRMPLRITVQTLHVILSTWCHTSSSLTPVLH